MGMEIVPPSKGGNLYLLLLHSTLLFPVYCLNLVTIGRRQGERLKTTGSQDDVGDVRETRDHGTPRLTEWTTRFQEVGRFRTR